MNDYFCLGITYGPVFLILFLIIMLFVDVAHHKIYECLLIVCIAISAITCMFHLSLSFQRSENRDMEMQEV